MIGSASGAPASSVVQVSSCGGVPRRQCRAGGLERGSTMSPMSVQFSTYERSRRTDSSHDSVERPLTCQRPVIPGLTMNLR